MNGAKYFDNQIIKVQNLEFQRDATEKNITDNFLAFTKQSGGITQGLVVTSGTGLVVNVSQGVAYDNNGQRMEAYSGVSFVATSGMVWATLVESDYNPDPASIYASFPVYGTAQTNINPTNGVIVDVSTFNTMVINQTSGIGSIPLARVNATVSDVVGIDADLPYRQDLLLVGILNVNTSTIDGEILELGTVDSNRFTNPLHYDFYLSGISIYTTVSGSSRLGTPELPFLDISTKTLNVTNISGLSPIHFKNQIFLDNASGNSIISVEGTGALRINPSGQDVYIGGDVPFQQGRLWTNHISPRIISSGPVFPTLTLDGAGIIMNTTGYPANAPSFNVRANNGMDISTIGTNSSAYGIRVSGNRVAFGAINQTTYPNYGSFLTLDGALTTLTAGAVNISAGAPSAAGGNISLTAGSPTAGISLNTQNILIASGTLIDNINFKNTRQSFENLVSNPEFIISNRASGVNYGNYLTNSFFPGDNKPNAWEINVVDKQCATWAGPFQYRNVVPNTTDVQQYFRFPINLENALQGLTSYTFEFQFRVNGNISSNGTDFSCIWMQNTTYSVGVLPRIEFQHSLQKINYFNQSTSRIYGTTATPSGVWHSCAMVFSGTAGSNGDLRIYLDNLQDAPTASVNTILLSGNGKKHVSNYVGAFVQTTAWSSFANIELANLKISNIARPSGSFAGAIASTGPNGSFAIDANTLAYYKFENDYKDSTSNGYDLLNAGFPVKLNVSGNGTVQLVKPIQLLAGGVNEGIGPDTSMKTLGCEYGLYSTAVLNANGINHVTPLKGLKPNTQYNVSFYYADGAGQGILFKSSIGGSVQQIFSTATTDWQRAKYTFTTPSTLTDNNLTINVSLPVVANAIYKLTGVQVTEGYSALPYIKENTRVLVYKKSGQQQYVDYNYEYVNVLDFDCDNVWTRGGKVSVNASISFGHQADNSSSFSILVDGREVMTVPSRGTQYQSQMEISWSGQLSAGSHRFTLVEWGDGSGGRNVINIAPYYFPATSSFLITEE